MLAVVNGETSRSLVPSSTRRPYFTSVRMKPLPPPPPPLPPPPPPHQLRSASEGPPTSHVQTRAPVGLMGLPRDPLERRFSRRVYQRRLRPPVADARPHER